MTASRPAEKDALRRHMKRLRQLLPAEDAARASAQATAELLALDVLDVDVVCCFVSFRREIDTHPLLRALLDRGTTVGVPQVVGRRLECRRLRSFDDLRGGTMGVPTSDGEDLGDRVGAVIVPGLAFSPDGGRIGYGAGYYDRYLAPLDVPAIGFGFERQILPVLPIEDHDEPLSAVVTEAGVHTGWPTRAIRVVAGAIVRDGKVFAARRGPGQSQAGWWELPGGKVEAGETEPDALVRELREELGITVRVTEPFALAIHPYPGVEVALSAWSCALDTGEIRPTEHDRVGWFNRTELLALPWAPADLPIVREIAALAAG